MGLAELSSLTKKHTHADGATPTAIPFLSLIRASKPTPLRSGILEPSICLVVEGDKRLLVGREAHRYGAGSYCMTKQQYQRGEGYIRSGIEEGTELLAGGEGRPADLARGYFVKPTIFVGVKPEMRIAREEITC